MSRPKIILKHTYDGLGDNLTHSTLPEIFTNRGFDVFISTKQGYRNEGVKQLIDSNPFIKGYSDELPNLNVDEYLKTTYPYNHPNKNYHARIELALFGEFYNNYPKIYYTPKLLPEWQDRAFVDFTSVTVKDHPVHLFVDYAHKKYDNCVIGYKTKDIFEYIDIIHSCKQFLCTYSGGMVLAAAINKQNVSCCVSSQWINHVIKSAYFYHYDNVNYISVDKLEDSIINVKE